MAGVSDYTKTVRIGSGTVAAKLIGGPGTVPANRIPTLPSIPGSISIITKTFGTLAASRVAALDASKIATGTLSSARIPFLDTSKITTGTFGVARIPLLQNIPGTLPINTKASGTLAASRVPSLDASKIATGTFANARIPNLDASKITTGTLGAARHQLLQNIPGTLPINTKASGTLASSRIPSLDASKITTGTFGVARIPFLSASQITSGTFTNPRLPRQSYGTFSGVFNAGSANRGTLPSGRAPSLSSGYIGTLPSARIPFLDTSKITTGTFTNARLTRSPTFGTVTMVSSGANINTAVDNTNQVGLNTNRWAAMNAVAFKVFGARGDANPTSSLESAALKLGAGGTSAPDTIISRAGIAAINLPKVGTFTAANINAGSLNRGTVPSNRIPSSTGTLAGARNAGSLVRGTLGLNRGAGMLGTVLKQRIIAVSQMGFALNTGTFIRAFHLTVPSGLSLKVWQMGIKQTSGSAGTGPLVAKVYSDSQGTSYRRGSGQYLAGTPLVKVPAGTRASFRFENTTGVIRNITGYFFATIE